MCTSRTLGESEATYFTTSSTAIVYARGSLRGAAAKAQKSQVATHTFVWLMCVFRTKYAASPWRSSRTRLASAPRPRRSWVR